MNYRVFGKTGFKVSEVSLGTWQLGSKWGDPFDEQVAMNTLQAAYEQGVNLIDTADIYQDGMSEHTVGKFLKGKKDKVFVVTKWMFLSTKPLRLRTGLHLKTFCS